MEVINKIIDGVHSDNDPNHQPDNTMRRSLNGVIMDVGEGNYIWEVMKGTSVSFALGPGTRIMGYCRLRDRFIILTLNPAETYAHLREVTFNSDGVGTTETLWFGANTDLNLSSDHPIRSMFGFYESQEIQKIYFTDYYNPPRIINIGYEDPLNKTVSFDAKFLPFSPNIDRAYGKFSVDAIVPGGSLLAGNYFFCWRYIHNDYYSDWSYLSAPVHIANGNPGYSPDQYQAYQGGAPDEVTTNALRIRISDLDDDYDSIQIAAFYSNDYNSAGPGTIFYDGGLTSDEMVVVFNGSENAGIVTIDELIQTSINIEKCRDMTTIKKLNVIGNVKLREEIDVSGLNVEGKNNQVDCDASATYREVILDRTGYPTESWTAGNKGLFQSPLGVVVDASNPNMYCGIQYQGIEAGQCDLDNGGTQSWDVDEIFIIDSAEPDGAMRTSGSCRPVIALKKYRKSSGVSPFTWDDYEWEIKSLVGEYLDYKSSIVSNMIKSYPGGETVRLGLVCFDLTGRPFYARWLNVNSTVFGDGDLIIPKRNKDAAAGSVPLLQGYDTWTAGTDIIYNQLNGRSFGVKISALDLTDIIDQISAFMIVQVPIDHQYIGSGILKQTFENTNDVFCAPGFRESYSDNEHHPGTYALFSPEDMFGLKDFVLQPGDQIENHQYLIPYYRSETGEASHQGYGRASVPDQGVSNDIFNLYQKLLIESADLSPGGDNSDIGESHELLYSTPYHLQDSDLVFDPRNEILRYQARTYRYANITNRYGVNGRHNIIVLDIDESGNNPKGVYQCPAATPIALQCKIKRLVTSPYGGTDDSSLSNSRYISIGHFQVIDDTVKTDIESGGRYIFNEIEIFGGDHFIGLMAVQDVLVDDDSSDYKTGHGFIFPVESRVNVALREGVHLGKERPYHETTNTSGIKHKVGEFKLEEYNYNDGYSSVNIHDYYIAYPYNITFLTEVDVQLRFSPEKSYGERRDSFRVFNTNDFLNLDSNFGELINIRAKYNRLIYWQTDAVGYIPIRERALTQGQFGDPVQLGVGDVFERYDEMTDKLGNSNQFGLVESDMGFHWYDARRKMYITLTEALKFSQDSVAKGWNNWFDNYIDTNILDYDNPMKVGGYGICGGYDPQHKVVFHSFHNPDTANVKTIGFDIRNQKLIGEFTMEGSWWMRYENFLFSIKPNGATIYVHGKGDRGIIHNAAVNSEIQIVVKLDDHTPLVFDNYEIIGGDKFFDQVTIENSDQTIVETIQEYISGQYRFVNRNYQYRNRRWYGNFPKEVNERFVDGYLIVTFRAVPQETKFLEMKTTVRKAY